MVCVKLHLRERERERDIEKSDNSQQLFKTLLYFYKLLYDPANYSVKHGRTDAGNKMWCILTDILVAIILMIFLTINRQNFVLWLIPDFYPPPLKFP